MKMAPNERERGREKAGDRWGIARVCICVKIACQPVYMIEKAEKCRRIKKRMCSEDLLYSSVSPTVLRGAQKSQRRESETDPQQGSASSIFLARLLLLLLLLTPPHPSLRLQHIASRHLSPLSPSVVCFGAPLSIFSLLTSYSPSFHPFLTLCLSTHPSLCSHPSLFLRVSDGQIDNGTAARSGVRAFSYQQHAWDSLHCVAYFHMTPRKLK